MNLIIAAVALLLQPVGSAAEQPPVAAQAQRLDAERTRAASELVATFNLDAQMRASETAFAETSAAAVVAEVERRFEVDVPADVEAQWLEAALQDTRTTFARVLPIVVRQMINIYAESFTEDELERLVHAMRDPLMQRLMNLQPTHLRRIMQTTMSEMPSDGETGLLVSRLRAWLESEGLSQTATAEPSPMR